MDQTNVVDAPQGEATEKETPVESTGTESVASDGSQEQDSAGGSQDQAEGGSVDNSQPRPRGRSKLDTIVELRSKLRERDQRYGSEIEALKSQIAELRGMASGGAEKKPRKTFWEAPEDVLEERIGSHLSEFEKRLISHFEQKEQLNQQTAEWKQETSEAAEFIKSQKGLTQDDIEDIKEIVRENPLMERMRPMERAEYAMFLWQKQRGITDRSALKAKAGTVRGSVGSPAQTGPKVWTNAEVEAEIAKRFSGDPKTWTKEQAAAFDAFSNEIKLAQTEGRMK